MKPDHLQTAQEYAKIILQWLSHFFDIVADWVTQLSWARFFLYAFVASILGAILQDAVFSSGPVEEVTVTQHKKQKDKKDKKAIDVHIDENGLRVNKTPAAPPAPPAMPAKAASKAANEPGMTMPPPPPPIPGASTSTKSEERDEQTAAAIEAAKDATEATREATEALLAAVKRVNDIADKADQEAEDAANAAVEEKVTKYRNESSGWFKKFVVLLILTLFGTKALMGGKKRAEAQAEAAKAAAETEALNRQVSEAKVQMMQAQVEPHFLFNTLASVEYLIETDPPRASAMQRSLIKYLRAVLPQIREMQPSTNLGREADMVAAYLDLLKMRMEERLTVEIHIDEALRNAAFPPMMLQPLVENAIKHGLECKEEGGTLRVDASVVGQRLRIRVADDGVGFGVMPSDGTGLGLTSVRERLNLLYGNAGQLIIEPNQPSGVVAIIEVPYNLAN
jgi:signal transduction histidine kinase